MTTAGLGPISPELALVDPELAVRARALLPDVLAPAPRQPAASELPVPEPLPPPAPVREPAPEHVAAAAGPGRSRRRLGVAGGVVLIAVVAGLLGWKVAPWSSDGAQRSSTGEEEPSVLFSAPPTDPSLAPDAIAALEEGVRLEPRSALAREKLGTAYLRLGRWTDAEREFRTLVELAPDDQFAHFALGRALEELGRRTEAARHFAEAEKLAGSGP